MACRGYRRPPSAGYGHGPTSGSGAFSITNGSSSDNDARVYSCGPGWMCRLRDRISIQQAYGIAPGPLGSGAHSAEGLKRSDDELSGSSGRSL